MSSHGLPLNLPLPMRFRHLANDPRVGAVVQDSQLLGELCDDYRCCARALSLASHENPTDHSRVGDYQRLLQDLEDEIYQYLSKHLEGDMRTGPYDK